MLYDIENVKQSVSLQLSFRELFYNSSDDHYDISVEITEFSNRCLSFIENEYFGMPFSVIPTLSGLIILNGDSGQFVSLPYTSDDIQVYADCFCEYFSYDEQDSMILSIIISRVLRPYIQHIRSHLIEFGSFPYAE
jgi:hypothetical protein